MNAGEYIRECVTMTDICRKYGFRVNGTGFIICPFHHEKTASLKIYPGGRGWCCFGCGAKGSVIDFIQMYFRVGFKEAINIINRDFSLGLNMGKSDYRQRRQMQEKIFEAEQRRIAEAKRREEIAKAYDELLTEYVCCDLIIMLLKPKSPDDELDDNYVKAMHKMPVIEFELDCFDYTEVE